MTQATILITPRDRYTGIEACIENLYACTPEPFDLLVLDLGYPRKVLRNVEALLSTRKNAEVIRLGRIIPMEALRKVRDRIRTPFTVLLDNDSNVTPNWLAPLMETAEATGAGFVSPLILEKEGVDMGAELRNHLYTSDIRVVPVQGKPYLIENKHFRRTLPKDLPQETAATQTFELHCVMFATKVLHEIEIPQMVIREHIDIGMQLQCRGIPMRVDPRSVVTFDNLGTPMTLQDMRFFWFRWSPSLANHSSRLFAKRWGYDFYSEKSIFNWVFRRKTFLVFRWLHLPIPVANKMTSLMKKLFCRDFDPLKDPLGESKPLYDTVPNGIPPQLSHEEG